MDEDDFAAGRRREEAAQWFARLKTLPVSQGTLKDFFAWRRQRENAEAFEKAERFWSEAEKIGERPSILRAVQEAEARGRSSQRSGGLLRRVSVLLICLLAALIIVAVVRALIPGGQTFRTGTGEQRAIALEDGSRLNLNAETDVRVNYSPTARNLVLQDGEALFSVAHDKARPFVVTAGTATVTATGTQFDVVLRDNRTVVTLVEGSVIVHVRGGSTVRLRPGQQWASTGGASLRAVRTDTVTAWALGRIVFDDVRLIDAVAEINRHGGKPIILDSRQFEGRRISGSFEAGDSDSFASGVTAFLPLHRTEDIQGRIHLASTDEPHKEN